MSRRRFPALVCVLMTAVSGTAAAALAQSADPLLQAAAEALQSRQTQKALKLLNQAVEQEPKNVRALSLRAEVHENTEQYAAAARDWSQVIAVDPRLAGAYQQRGIVHFKMGKIKESIEDFDAYIALKPEAKVSHWQRGISYYYAGRYEDGRRQFEGYQEYDASDVENAVWRFLCMARSDGMARARQQILKIGNDRRVPMRQVYDLYQGVLKPEEVLAAARAGEPPVELLKRQLFYAHLYVGIYQDLNGDRKKALEHLDQAAGPYRIAHYMGDVARIHRDLLARHPSSGEKQEK